jgi:hypothetical protein
LLPSENSRTITCTAFAYKGTHLEGGLSGLLSQDKAPDREPVNLATRVARLGSKGITIIRRPLWAEGCILSAAAFAFNPRTRRGIVRHRKAGARDRPVR